MHKKQYEAVSKKNNDTRIQIEAQRRLIERTALEKTVYTGQPMTNSGARHK